MKIIKIEKTIAEQNSREFSRASMFKTGNDYLDYLLKLDQKINGDDCQINENYYGEFDKLSKDEADKKIDLLLKSVIKNLDYVIKSIPEEARISFIDEKKEYFAIAEDDFIHNTKVLVLEIIKLRKMLK